VRFNGRDLAGTTDEIDGTAEGGYDRAMGVDGWLTVGVVLAMVVVMALNLAGPDLVLVAGLTVLLASGVLDPSEAFSGFANPAVGTIAALFVVAAGIRETGALDYVARTVLGRPRNVAGAQLRVMLPVGFLSAFMNNTPVVAMFVPMLQRWSKQSRISVSKLLIPLSYAAILGGTCTLIGTSTNLVVAGMAAAKSDPVELGMFDVAVLGVPALVVGTLYILFASRWLLPARRGVDQDVTDVREYSIAFQVAAGSPVVNETIESTLRSLPKLYLFELERDGQVFPAVSPQTKLKVGDLLRFTGIVVDAAVDLRKMGLVPEESAITGRPDRGWVEAVVANQSALVGRTVRDARFRTEYDAAILAVHREGERVPAKVGDIVLQPGDLLLLEAEPGFARRHRADPSFMLLSPVADSAPPNHRRAPLAALILVAVVALNAAGVLPLLTAALLGAGALVLTGCLRGYQARRALDLRVLVTVGAALGVGLAVESSGAAEFLGNALVNASAPFGDIALLGSVFAATSVLAGLVYTATAAAVMYPIAAAAIEGAGMPGSAAALLVMHAASTAFSSPIGYAANLMVYGPGGYRYSDFIRMGLPLQVLLGALSVTILWVLWL